MTTLLGLAALSALSVSAAARLRREADHATVPLRVVGNRPLVDLTLVRQDGSRRTARFVLDSGGGSFILTETLAHDLGLTWGKSEREEGMELAKPTAAPRAYVGELPLDLDPNRVIVAVGLKNIIPKVAPGHADGLFPGHLLARYHVIFDYPSRTFTIARPGVLTPHGAVLPMPVGARSGFPQTEIQVGGKSYALLIDTGASFTIVSEAVLKAWGNDHPDWPRHPGAVGEAATLGGETLETMTVPGARWAALDLAPFGVVSQGEGVFEHTISAMTTSPVLGSLAGNVLKRYRLELDYPNQTLYLSAPSR